MSGRLIVGVEARLDGYYWARHEDGTTFIVLLEDGFWYCCGVEVPINDSFDPDSVICALTPAHH